jgi:hypothetical protein
VTAIDEEVASPQLENREGTIFGLRDMPLLFSDRDFRIGEIWDEEHPRVPDLLQMLRQDRALALWNALSLPIRGAAWSIEGGNLPDEEVGRLHEGLERAKIHEVIGQMTQAFAIRRTYHEKVWEYVPSQDGTSVGRFELEGIEWRPPADCVLQRDIKTGKEAGFKQAIMVPFTNAQSARNDNDGWFQIKKAYAVVYIHNKSRDPVKGMSDFDLVYWCYQQKMKLWFLWFQYCEASALPRTVIHARDPESGKKAVAVLATLKNSGVCAIPEEWIKELQTLDVSGKGAAEFQEAIQALDTLAADSVLEGFLSLAGAAVQNAVGSYALSNDLSDFFLQALTAAADEISDTITHKILHDLVRFNNPGLSPKDYPVFRIGPISEKDATPQLEMFRAVATAAKGSTNVPTGFMEQLILAVARVLDLDEKPIIDDLKVWRKQDEIAQLQQTQAPTPGAPQPAAGGTAAPNGVPNAQGSVRSVTNPPKPPNQARVRPGLRLPGGG